MKKYQLTHERFNRPIGTIVYDYTGHDYGLKRDDERATGIEHTCVTLKPSGAHPFFTIPTAHLQVLDHNHTATLCVTNPGPRET